MQLSPVARLWTFFFFFVFLTLYSRIVHECTPLPHLTIQNMHIRNQSNSFL